MKSINNLYKKMLDIGCGPGTINNMYYYETFRMQNNFRMTQVLLISYSVSMYINMCIREKKYSLN
jgi:hypothetical protein